MQLKDSPTRYGWISIALHWTGAVAVVMLWFIGNVMTAERTGETEHAELVHVHTSVAVVVYLLLWGRIVHRFAAGFPGPAEDERPVKFVITRLAQYVLLAAVATMLLSGPLMVWADGEAIGVFDWGSIPSPFEPNAALYDAMSETHRATRWVLLFVVLMHVGGVFLSRGETLNRMLLVPRER